MGSKTSYKRKDMNEKTLGFCSHGCEIILRNAGKGTTADWWEDDESIETWIEALSAPGDRSVGIPEAPLFEYPKQVVHDVAYYIVQILRDAAEIQLSDSAARRDERGGAS